MKNLLAPLTRLLLLSLFLSAMAALVAADEADAPKPNIIVFLVDDMGCMDSSVPFLTDTNGVPTAHPLNERYRTPNMERLAAQGIRFSTFYAMSVCSPTRVSLMTGQTSARHRTTQWIRPEAINGGTFEPDDWAWKGISPEHLTLPALLREDGYRTIHAGKAHFGPNDSFGEDPSNWGFDVNIAGCANGAPGSYLGTKNFGHGGKRAHRAVPGLEAYHGKDIHLTEATTIEFNKALSKAVADEKPFFGYLSHYAVHSPFEVDERFAANYPNAKGKMKAFLTMIEGIDKSLGDVLDHLEALGVAKETLVFFVGDNGTDAPNGGVHEVGCAAPLRGKKGTHYEGGMRVPFIAAWAKPSGEGQEDKGSDLQKSWAIPAGGMCGAVGTVNDLFPTVLAATGTKAPKDHIVDGRNLRPFLLGKKADSADKFLMHFPHAHRSSYFTVYRERRLGGKDKTRTDWKLIRHDHPKEGAPSHELFDLGADPYEAENLAERRPDKLKSMVAAMEKALEKTEAQPAKSSE